MKKHIDYCWNCEIETRHNGQWCCECGKSEHEDPETLKASE